MFRWPLHIVSLIAIAPEWRRGPNNRTAGQGNLRMRLRDMARIGEMVLHEGEIGTGKGTRRVVSSARIKRSRRSQEILSRVLAAATPAN